MKDLIPVGSLPGEKTRRILHLTLHRRWFDAIASGEKKEEYREIKPFWTKRFTIDLPDGQWIWEIFDEIHFRNGYAKAAPWMRVEWSGMKLTRWDGKDCYAIQLGRILEIRNYKAPEGEALPEPSQAEGSKS